MDSNEQLVPMDERTIEYFKKAIEDMARGSLRCVAFAYRPLNADTLPTYEEELTHWELLEGGLVLLEIVGLKNPCRPGVRDAIQLCVKPGVKVRMVMGDNLQTAKAIALECGILGSDADATKPKKHPRFSNYRHKYIIFRNIWKNTMFYHLL
ncbi:putative P-type Ca(2+) transporter [Helianthus anomalus]